MKKILSVVIAISMLLGMMIPMGITTSAAEATECATWAEVVAAVEADSTASIKLTNHVTANSTIASFAGTFDGNGYTVTVEDTMFAEVTGTATLKNFQTAAAAAITVAPIINLLKGDATVVIEKVVNNVDVAESTEQMGGIIAKTSGTVSLTMTSCVNNGDLQTLNQASGIVGNADGTLTVNFTDVVNNGNITGNQNYAAGILCTNGGVEGTMTRVVNNGNIVIESKKANNKGSNGAGIIGTAKGKTVVTFTECVNTGDVTLITENTSAHYGVSAFATRTDNESSVFTINSCVSTGVMTSATAGTTADAIALPAKKGAASATNTSYVNGETTVAGATKVDAAAAEAAIAAIEAKMTLPTFDADKAPEGGDDTDEPATERFAFFIDAGFATVTVDGPKYMKVGDLDAITVTFDVPGKGTNCVGAGFVSSDTAVVDFPGEVVVTTDTGVQLNEVTNIHHENSAFSCWTDQGVANEVVITIPVSALSAGTADITLLDIEDGYLFTFCDADMENIYQYDSLDIGYTITVVDENGEGGDEPTEPIVVDTVNVNGYAAPTVGADIAESLAALTVPDGAGYTINDAYWYNGSSIIYNGTFEAGKTYNLAIELTLADGYALADSVSFTINGSADSVDTTYSFANDGGIHIESVSTTLNATGSDEPTVIDTIGINGFVKPTEGASVAENIAALQAAGEGYTISAVWYTFGDELAGDTFGASSYFLRVAITANEGYIIADNATFTINGGANDDIIDASNSTVYEGGASALLDTVYINAGTAGGGDTTEEIEIDSADVSGITAPESGKTVADYEASFVPELPADAKYDVTGIYWFELDPETMMPTTEDPLADDYVFDSAKTYAFVCEMHPEEGYVFATDAVLTANGGTTELYISDIAGDIAILAIVLTPAEGGEGGDTTPDGSEENPFVITNKDDVDAIDVPAGETYYFIIDPWNVPETSLEDFIGNLLKVIGEGATINGNATLDLPTNGRMGWPVLFSITAANEDARAEIVVPKGTFNNPDSFDADGKAEVSLTSPKNDFEPYIFIFKADKNGILVVTAPDGTVVTINNLTSYSYGDMGVNTADVVAGDEIQIIIATEGADAAGTVSVTIVPHLNIAVWTKNGDWVTADELAAIKAGFAALLAESDIDASKLGIEWVELTTDGNKVADLGALVNAGDFDIIVGCGNNVDSTAGVTIVEKADINSALVAAGRKAALLDAENELAVALYDYLTYVAPVEIDKIDVSGITAPEYGKTVADYKASFVPVLPDGAKYSITNIAWAELDPETMLPTTDEPLADDYVFDSSKIYAFICTMQPEEGYVFAREAVITANGGALELYESVATDDFAGVAVVFNPTPTTGDNSTIAIFAIAAVATIGCVAIALRKKKED